MPTAFLSKPAARPSTLGKVSPIACTGAPPGVRRRASTGRAARTARKPSRCARSGSTRVKPWSNSAMRTAGHSSARNQSCSDRTPIEPRIDASMPCTAAPSPCTVVMHGMFAITAAVRIS